MCFNVYMKLVKIYTSLYMLIQLLATVFSPKKGNLHNNRRLNLQNKDEFIFSFVYANFTFYDFCVILFW